MTANGRLWARIGATGFALGLAVPGAAQVPPAGRADPAAQLTPTRPQVETPRPEEAQQPRSRVEVRDALPPGPCPLADSPLRVAIREVRFESARGGDLPAPFVRLLAPLTRVEPGERPLADVCAIRDQANQALYDSGYVASVQIPTQEIEGGVLRLSVVSARIVEVRVTGVSGALGADLNLRVERLRQLDPLNRREAERLLLLARDVPGLNLALTLQPAGREPGDVVAELAVNRQPGLLLANYQNTGSRQLGPGIASLRGELYNLTGLSDLTYVGVSNSTQWDEVHVIQAGHSMGVGTSGARFEVRGSFARSNPSITGLDLRSTSVIAGTELRVPFFRGLRRQGGVVSDLNTSGAIGFELLNQRTVIRQSGADVPFTEDRLRAVYLRFNSRAVLGDGLGEPISVLDGFLEARRGLDIFNATPRGPSGSLFQPSRFEGDPEAVIVRGEVRQTTRPRGPLKFLSFDLRVFGQWANHPLLNLEEFTIGNLTYGRGYDPGANAGDRAIGVRLEPRVRLTPAGNPFGVELFGFYDSARIWNLDTGSTETNRQLRSVGGGVSAALPGRLNLDVTYARPLDRVLTTSDRRPRERVLVSLTAKLLPWGIK